MAIMRKNYVRRKIIFYLFKTTIEGSGGTGNYMLQRFLSAKSDRECGLLSLFWTFLLSFRWPFIAALAMMGGMAFADGHSVVRMGTEGAQLDDKTGRQQHQVAVKERLPRIFAIDYVNDDRRQQRQAEYGQQDSQDALDGSE